MATLPTQVQVIRPGIPGQPFTPTPKAPPRPSTGEMIAAHRQQHAELLAKKRARVEMRIQRLEKTHLQKWLHEWTMRIQRAALVATEELAARARVEIELGPNRVPPVAPITHVKRLIGKRAGRHPAVPARPGSPPIAWRRTGRLFTQALSVQRTQIALSSGGAAIAQYQVGFRRGMFTDRKQAGGGNATSIERVVMLNEFGGTIAVPITVASLRYLHVLYGALRGEFSGHEAREGERPTEPSAVVGVAMVRIPARPIIRPAYLRTVAALPAAFVTPFRSALRGPGVVVGGFALQHPHETMPAIRVVEL